LASQKSNKFQIAVEIFTQQPSIGFSRHGFTVRKSQAYVANKPNEAKLNGKSNRAETNAGPIQSQLQWHTNTTYISATYIYLYLHEYLKPPAFWMRLIELHDTTKITWQQDRQAKRTRTVSLDGAGIPLD